MTDPRPSSPTSRDLRTSSPEDGSLLDELSPVEYSALRWTVRAGDGLDADERQELQDWLDADPSHRRAFAEMQSVADAVAALPPAAVAQLQASVVLDSAAQQAHVSLERSAKSAAAPIPEPDAVPVHASAEPLVSGHTDGAMRRRALLKTSLATSLVAVLTAGSWLGWDRWQNLRLYSQHYATLRGQQGSMSLPDGSRITLDVASRVDVNLYRNRREVQLHEGQAVFHVEADPRRPFTVMAGKARVTVVGTVFSVRYLPSLGDASVEVRVLKGKVRVAAFDGKGQLPQTAELTPGQAIAVNMQGALGTVASVGLADFASWQSGRLNFENTRLDTVLAELERYGEHRIRLENGDVAQMRLTASLDLKNIEGFLRILPRVLPVRVQESRDFALVQRR